MTAAVLLITLLITAAALLVLQGVTFLVALRVGKHSVVDTAWGIGIALAGFAFESIGDWQLARFKASATSGQIMDRGLWRYTRHPNYFGDFCMWWGLFAISFGSWRELPALAGPLLMTFILTRGTGARMTDRRMTASRPQYADYVARTSGFIPLPPKRAPKRSAAAAAPGERV
jgi:steroid 5-alpha reductase family enzyme